MFQKTDLKQRLIAALHYILRHERTLLPEDKLELELSIKKVVNASFRDSVANYKKLSQIVTLILHDIPVSIENRRPLVELLYDSIQAQMIAEIPRFPALKRDEFEKLCDEAYQEMETDRDKQPNIPHNPSR